MSHAQKRMRLYEPRPAQRGEIVKFERYGTKQEEWAMVKTGSTCYWTRISPPSLLIPSHVTDTVYEALQRAAANERYFTQAALGEIR